MSYRSALKRFAYAMFAGLLLIAIAGISVILGTRHPPDFCVICYCCF
jgi:hypothetical protein